MAKYIDVEPILETTWNMVNAIDEYRRAGGPELYYERVKEYEKYISALSIVNSLIMDEEAKKVKYLDELIRCTEKFRLMNEEALEEALELSDMPF